MNTFIKYKIKEGVEKWSDKDIHTKYKPSSNDSTAYLVKSAWKHLRAYSQFLYWSTVCRPAPFYTPRLRNTTTGNVYTSCDFPKTAGWALGRERVTRNKMMSNSPSRLQFRLLRESLSKKQELWHRCWESAALGCLFRGGGTNSLGSWEPSQKLCLEPCPALPWTSKRNYGNPSQDDHPELKNKVSSIKMDWDVSENKSFPKCQEGCCCSFLLFNTIKMIFFFKLRNLLSVTASSQKSL